MSIYTRNNVQENLEVEGVGFSEDPIVPRSEQTLKTKMFQKNYIPQDNIINTIIPAIMLTNSEWLDQGDKEYQSLKNRKFTCSTSILARLSASSKRNFVNTVTSSSQLDRISPSFGK